MITGDRLLEEALATCPRDPQAALRLTNEALQQAETARDNLSIARALRVRGMAHGSLGKIENAFADFLAAREWAHELGDRKLEAQCLHGLANAYYYQGQYAYALEYAYRTIAARRELDDERGLMAALTNIGAYHGALGNYDEAVHALTEAVEIARRVGDEHAEALTLSNIALCKHKYGENAAAIVDFEESVRLADHCDDRVVLSNTLANLADLYRLVERLEEAAATADRAVDLARQITNPHREATALSSRGQIRAARGEFAEAEQDLRNACEIARKAESGRQFAALLGTLGSFYQERGNLTEARRHLEAGLERATENEQRQEMADLHHLLARLCETEGDMAGALRHERAFGDADRSLQKENARNRMLAQMARWEVEKAKQESEIHRLRTVELARANQEKAELLERLQLQANRLAREATEDPLTGLYNRRYLSGYLENEIERAHRTGARLALAIADLDDFKKINDRFTHRIGDEVLKQTADLMREAVRRIDVVARYGGEEFVVVFPETDREAAAFVCERLRAVIDGFDWTTVHPDLQVTVSIGLAEYGQFSFGGDRKLDLLEGDALLAQADKRLYEAKRSGKNRLV